MGQKDLVSRLREEDRVKFDINRFEHLSETVDIYWRRAGAIVLAENGYSSSGMSQLLDVTESTCSGYLDDITEEFGDGAIETHPQSEPVDELWPDGYENPF
jgi:hypothetical protein